MRAEILDPARRLTWLTTYVRQRIPLEPLVLRGADVMCALPDEVLCDLLEDPNFHLALENHRPGIGNQVFFSVSAGPWTGSRSVVLRRRLADSPVEFALYVIAHEFAHAHLRNGGHGPITDPEHAADTLASHWGFSRPGWF